MFNLGKLAPFLLRAVAVIPAAVQTAQSLRTELHTPGADAKAAVVAAAQAELAAGEAIAGGTWANDADVLAAVGAISDAVVNLHKLVAHKAGAAPPSA